MPESYTDTVHTALKAYYNFEILILPDIDLPQSAWYAPRKRYRADSLLDFLYGIMPDSVDYIMGLTNKDISTTKGKYNDWGILGLGRMPGAPCIVSSFRLGRNARNAHHVKQRLARVARHELGHNLGLPHCASELCFMRDAKGKLETVDMEGDSLCQICQQKIVRALN